MYSFTADGHRASLFRHFPRAPCANPGCLAGGERYQRVADRYAAFFVEHTSNSCCKRAVSNCTASAARSMRLSEAEGLAATRCTPGEKRLRPNPQPCFPLQHDFARKCPQT